MLKKCFFIVLPIMFFAFYGCSSMKHSTVVLYVSHKVEGPLYMPEAEPPVETRNPQIEREIAERENQAKQESESKKPTRSKATQDSQANQNSAPAQTNETKPTRGSKATQDSQANQNSEPAQATETKPTRGSKATQDSQANQNSEPAQATETKKPTSGSQSSTQVKQEAQESKPSQSRPSRGTPTAETEEKQTTSSPSQERKPAARRRANQDNQATATNTYQNGYQTRTLPRGELLILEKPIRFAFEKYGIGSDYDDTVQYVADFMKQNTNFRLVVEGHTDRVGEYDFNSNLSLRRSRSAISKLVRAGVERNRLIESGVSYRFSEYNFNRLNRRVEFIIIRSPEELAKYREGVKEE